VRRPLAAIGATLLAPACIAIAAPATPSETCLRIATELERTRQARQEAVDKGDTAWKAVLPFVVIARKTSSKAAIDEADQRLAALHRQADAEGCSDAR
jgi:hypothetical protein